jgi:hypothetical protein
MGLFQVIVDFPKGKYTIWESTGKSHIFWKGLEQIQDSNPLPK